MGTVVPVEEPSRRVEAPAMEDSADPDPAGTGVAIVADEDDACGAQSPPRQRLALNGAVSPVLMTPMTFQANGGVFPMMWSFLPTSSSTRWSHTATW